jgi:hypothetical protein
LADRDDCFAPGLFWSDLDVSLVERGAAPAGTCSADGAADPAGVGAAEPATTGPFATDGPRRCSAAERTDNVISTSPTSSSAVTADAKNSR